MQSMTDAARSDKARLRRRGAAAPREWPGSLAFSFGQESKRGHKPGQHGGAMRLTGKGEKFSTELRRKSVGSGNDLAGRVKTPVFGSDEKARARRLPSGALAHQKVAAEPKRRADGQDRRKQLRAREVRVD